MLMQMRLHRVAIVASLIGPASAVGQGVVVHYEFENNVLDSAGSAHGTVGGSPIYVPGRYEQALHLHNLVDTVTWAGVPMPPALTVSVWLKLDPATPPDRYWFLDHLASAGGWRGWQIKTEKLTGTSGQILWILADNFLTRRTTTGAAVPLFDGQWHHIAATHDGASVARVYFDGEQVGYSTGYAYMPPPSTRIMSLINRPQSPQSGINEVDELTIWNRVLSAVEVADLYQDTCIHVAPAAVSRYHIHGSGGSVAPVVYTVTNTAAAGQSLTYAVEEVVDQPWLTLSKTAGGPLNYLGTDVATATINAAGLPVGSYTCAIYEQLLRRGGDGSAHFAGRQT